MFTHITALTIEEKLSSKITISEASFATIYLLFNFFFKKWSERSENKYK